MNLHAYVATAIVSFSFVSACSPEAKVSNGSIDVSDLNGHCDTLCDCMLVLNGNICNDYGICDGGQYEPALYSNYTEAYERMQTELDSCPKEVWGVPLNCNGYPNSAIA